MGEEGAGGQGGTLPGEFSGVCSPVIASFLETRSSVGCSAGVTVLITSVIFQSLCVVSLCTHQTLSPHSASAEGTEGLA